MNVPTEPFTLPRQKKNKQGKLEHIEDNDFIFEKINQNQNTKEKQKNLGAI